MSRQKAYQQRHRALGLCQSCPEPLASRAFCWKHLLAKREKERVRKNLQPWRAGHRGRRPTEVALT
jgi:hypothetical protein